MWLKRKRSQPMSDLEEIRPMEDMFFFKREQSLLKARRELEQLKETKENLARVSGIRNDELLEKLIALNVRPETLASLLAIPLVEVAWADGDMHEKERTELLKHTERSSKKGFAINHELIEVWLSQKPDPALMDAWVHYVRTLSSQLNETERQALKKDVLTDARAVAEAAGGFMGFGRLSDSERSVLSKLEAAFG